MCLQVLDLQRALHADPSAAGSTRPFGGETLDLRDIAGKVWVFLRKHFFLSILYNILLILHESIRGSSCIFYSQELPFNMTYKKMHGIQKKIESLQIVPYMIKGNEIFSEKKKKNVS
jgi:hypothetical protein